MGAAGDVRRRTHILQVSVQSLQLVIERGFVGSKLLNLKGLGRRQAREPHRRSHTSDEQANGDERKASEKASNPRGLYDAAPTIAHYLLRTEAVSSQTRSDPAGGHSTAMRRATGQRGGAAPPLQQRGSLTGEIRSGGEIAASSHGVGPLVVAVVRCLCGSVSQRHGLPPGS